MTDKKKKSPQPSESNLQPAYASIASAAEAAMPQFVLHSVQVERMQQIGGPLPHPDILKKYDQVSPGLAERIVKMAEEETAHRRQLEVSVIAAQRSDLSAYRRSEMMGQIFGLIIGLAALGSAAYMAVRGAQTAASVIGAGGVTGLVTAFILGRSLLLKQKQQDFQQAQQAIQQQQSAIGQQK